MCTCVSRSLYLIFTYCWQSFFYFETPLLTGSVLFNPDSFNFLLNKANTSAFFWVLFNSSCMLFSPYLNKSPQLFSVPLRSTATHDKTCVMETNYVVQTHAWVILLPGQVWTHLSCVELRSHSLDLRPPPTGSLESGTAVRFAVRVTASRDRFFMQTVLLD